MKKLLFALTVFTFIASPLMAVPDAEFNPNSLGWSYDGSGTFTFGQSILVRRVQGAASDPLVGSLVNIPALTVAGLPGGPYSLTASAPIEIVDGGGTTLMSGTLGQGSLIPIGAVAAAYPYIKADITNITINNAISSSLLTYWRNNSSFGIDLSLSVENNINVAEMLAGGIPDSGGLSGSMTLIPEPATIMFLGLGMALISAGNRRRVSQGRHR